MAFLRLFQYSESSKNLQYKIYNFFQATYLEFKTLKLSLSIFFAIA